MSQCASEALRTVARGNTLTSEMAEDFMNELMDGGVSPIQTAGLLSAIAVRGETVDEIVGFVRAMRKHSVRVETGLDVVDTCGTGGSGIHKFNVSTAAAFVAAAAGVPVAKHGNRAASGRSGSADVLLALGSNIDLNEQEFVRCLKETHLGFLFAQKYHPAMKHAAEPRRQLGFRTVFNILGPLTNPAGAKRQVIGVPRPDLVDKVAEALGRLHSKHVMVVHGAGGIDEFSLAGSSVVAELRDGHVSRYTVDPEDVGLARGAIHDILGGDPATNGELIRKVFAGEPGPLRDIVVFNAGAVLYVAGEVTSLAEGVRRASDLIDSGEARTTLDAFVNVTRQLGRAGVAL